MELQKNTAPAHGGLKCDKIRTILPQHIVHSDVANGQYLSEHTLSGGSWNDFYFIKETASFTEEPVIIDGAEFFRAELQCLIAGASAYQIAQLGKIKKRKLHVMFTDADGTKRIIGGTKDSFVTCVVGAVSTKAIRPERREVAVVFVSVNRHRTAVYPF